MRIRQMEAELFYIVQALVHIEVGLSVAPFKIKGFERGPWSKLRRQIPADIVSGKTKDAPDASEDVHFH
jgi:hypothetical protein